MFKVLKPLFTWRFIKFGVVGASGVLVNFAFLALFSKVFGWHANFSAALAILISINSNFWVNELWTFRDRRVADSKFVVRWVRFALISSVGGGVQWVVFVLMNLVVALIFGFELGNATDGIIAPFTNPPEVGNWIFISQLVGIGVAMFWNFMANFYWTWRHGELEEKI